MKRYIALVVGFVLVTVVARGLYVPPVFPSNAYNFIFQEAGEYVQLGMTRHEVEASFGRAEGPYGTVIYSRRGMLRVFFEDDILVSVDTMFYDCRWIFPGGLRTGSSQDEIENVFDISDARLMEFGRFRQITFFFTEDSVLIPFGEDYWWSYIPSQAEFEVQFTIDTDTQKIDTISLSSSFF